MTNILPFLKNNKHHPTDVIAGALIGSFAQIMNILGVAKIFEDEIRDIEIQKQDEVPMTQLGKKMEKQSTTQELVP